MMPHDTSAKGRPSREVREERARAFWQAQINEGRARAAEQQARTNKPAAPPQDPPPSPHRRRAFLCTSYLPIRHTADTTPPIDSLDHTGSLSRGDICPSPDQCRHVGRSPLLGYSTGQRSGRLEARADHSPEFDRSRPLKTVIDSWLQTKVLETRSYRDPIDRRDYPGLFVNTPRRACGSLLYTSAQTCAGLAGAHACAPPMDCSNSLRSRPDAFILYPQSASLMFQLDWRKSVVVRTTISFRCGSATALGAQTKVLLTECKNERRR